MAHDVLRLRRVLVAAVLMLLTSLPALAQEQLCQDNLDNDGDSLVDVDDPDCQCLDDVFNAGNCTANDVSFVLIGLGTQNDGCVNPTDTLGIRLGARLQTTANTRYDVGMWVALDGGTARTGHCSRQILTPISLLLPDPTNPAGTGPFAMSDTDQCGDIRADDGVAATDPDAIYAYPFFTQLPCGSVTNGFLNISTCATWANSANGISCADLRDAGPETTSKCRCEAIQTDVPVANLFCSATGNVATQGQMSCALSDTNGNGSLDPGEHTHCTVWYTNPVTCTNPTPTPAERFRCGTAAFTFFQIDYDENRGFVDNVVAGDGGAFDTTATGVAPASGSVLQWEPRSASSTANIIGPGRSFSLTFDYNLTDTTSTANTTFTMRTLWSNSSSLSSPVVQGVTCGTSVTTTPVTVAAVDSQRQPGGGATIRWSTATETANVGFNVYVRRGDDWQKVNDELIPSRTGSSLETVDYEMDLPHLASAEFLIEDVDAKGDTRRHGPFKVGQSSGVRGEAPAIDWQVVRQELTASERPRRLSRITAGAKGGNGNGNGGGNGNGKTELAADLRLDHDGLYRVTYDDLVAAGLDPSSVAAGDLALMRRGASVSIAVVASGRTFGPGSYLEFYGQAEKGNFYTSTSVYHLVVDKKAGRAIASESAPPAASSPVQWHLATRTVDTDNAYSVNSPVDPWYNAFLQAPRSPRSASFSLPADGLTTVPGVSPTLSVVVGGGDDLPANPDHHLRFKLNGVAVGEAYFDGFGSYRFETPLPAGVLAAANTLTIELPADQGLAFDRIYLESYGVTYPRQLTASGSQFSFRAAGEVLRVEGAGAGSRLYRLDAGGPVALTGATSAGGNLTFRGTAAMADYLLVGAPLGTAVSPARLAVDLTGGSADYLVISHRAFVDGIAPLVARRQAEGLSVRVVDVADVYAQYSDGVVDAQAIHDYVKQAVAGQGVRYVLLVGGDTYDYRNVLGIGSVSFVPTLYGPTSDIVFWSPIDPLFGDVDGDRVPDVAVGRLPVRSTAELSLLVGKTLQYESRSEPDSALFAADAIDGDVSFSQDSDRMVSLIGPAWNVQRAYVDTLGFAAARQQLLAGLNGGPALTSFVGHSGPTFWSFGGLFGFGDVAGLSNFDRPSVVIQWGCWNTYHPAPRFNTLGHELLLAGDQGAAAVLGASTLLETSSAQALSGPLAEALGGGPVALGDAVLAAKRQLPVDGNDYRDAMLGWTLLGDPALPIIP